MTKHFFIGVDGGATKCIVRVEDQAGQLLGRESAGPANIRISVEQAWQSIYAALKKILHPNAIQLENPQYHFHMGLGLAGCEILSSYDAFINTPHHFKTLKLTSDAHTACLGAHDGKDGTIIIAGTGVVGFQVSAKETHKIAGWGFPHDDEGGGAWMGLEAVKLTLQWLDERIVSSGLTQAIFAHFHEDINELVAWANQANSTAFAQLAPIVITENEKGDDAARTILQRAAHALDKIWVTLQAKQKAELACALIGGISTYLQPYLSERLQERLISPKAPPDVGAVWLVKSI